MNETDNRLHSDTNLSGGGGLLWLTMYKNDANFVQELSQEIRFTLHELHAGLYIDDNQSCCVRIDVLQEYFNQLTN